MKEDILIGLVPARVGCYKQAWLMACLVLHIGLSERKKKKKTPIFYFPYKSPGLRYSVVIQKR